MSHKTHTDEFNLDFMVGKTFDKIYKSDKRETVYFTYLYDSEGRQLQVDTNDEWEHHVTRQNFDKIKQDINVMHTYRFYDGKELRRRTPLYVHGTPMHPVTKVVNYRQKHKKSHR